MVALTCNLSYSADRNRRIAKKFKASLDNLVKPFLKIQLFVTDQFTCLRTVGNYYSGTL